MLVVTLSHTYYFEQFLLAFSLIAHFSSPCHNVSSFRKLFITSVRHHVARMSGDVAVVQQMFVEGTFLRLATLALGVVA